MFQFILCVFCIKSANISSNQCNNQFIDDYENKKKNNGKKSLNHLLTDACGDSLTYLIEGEKLIIFGYGKMSNYEFYSTNNKAPWHDNRLNIKNIQLPEGITYIGIDAFRGFKNLESITIPENVTLIGSNAFQYC